MIFVLSDKAFMKTLIMLLIVVSCGKDLTKKPSSTRSALQVTCEASKECKDACYSKFASCYGSCATRYTNAMACTDACKVTHNECTKKFCEDICYNQSTTEFEYNKCINNCAPVQLQTGT